MDRIHLFLFMIYIMRHGVEWFKERDLKPEFRLYNFFIVKGKIK